MNLNKRSLRQKDSFGSCGKIIFGLPLWLTVFVFAQWPLPLCRIRDQKFSCFPAPAHVLKALLSLICFSYWIVLKLMCVWWQFMKVFVLVTCSSGV